MALIRAWRRREDYREVVLGRLGPGRTTMRACGNLYTASLPAWLAAGLSEAVEQTAAPGPRWLAIGYGSGDAAEVLPLTLVSGWQAAAGRINFRAALDGAVDLDRAGYEALHDGRADVPAASGAFVIDRIGNRDEPGHVDTGIPHYAWA